MPTHHPEAPAVTVFITGLITPNYYSQGLFDLRNRTGPSCKFKQEHFELHTDTETRSKVSLIQAVVTGANKY